MSETQMKIDREKYLDILKVEGLPAALTALHRDVERIEFESFEGPGGYNPDLNAHLEEIRTFSRQLWRVSLGESPRS